MPTINQLPTVTSLSGGDQFAVYNNGNGDARKVSASALASYVNGLESSDTTTQYNSPLTGFVLPLEASPVKTFVVLTPAGTLSIGTLVLPLATGMADRAEITVVTTEAIAHLNFTLNGATAIYGEPTTLAAEGYFTLKYDSGLNSWFRVA